MNRIKLVVLVALLVCLLFGTQQAAGAAEAGIPWRSSYLIVAQDNNSKWSPAVAYSPQHDRYLVVWENYWSNEAQDVYGRMIGASGLMQTEFIVYSAANYSKQPSVTYDTAHDKFLAVWAYDSTGDGLDNDIYGRLIPWDGPNPSETAFAIDNSRANSTKPRVVYAPTSSPVQRADVFIIAWKVEDDPPTIGGGIIDDTKLGFPFSLPVGGGARDFPDVAFNQASDEFVVVWDEDVSRTTFDLDIYGARFNSSGAIQSPGVFPISSLLSVEQHPTVASCYKANQYLIAWQQQVNTSTDDNIFGRAMSGAGKLEQSYGIAGTTLPQQYPRLSCNTSGGEYLLVWHDQYADPFPQRGVWAEVIVPPIDVKRAFEVVAPSDTRDRLYPAVAYGNKSALVVWQHARESSGYLDIWAQIIKPYIAFLATVKK